MRFEVLSPGLQTTVQDLGRHGFRHLGVGIAGALDTFSVRVGNALVGNTADAAVLEIALQGPRLRLDTAACLAITGADIDARVGDTVVPGWRPVLVPAGGELVLGACRRGARAYLAIAGGIDVARVLGSASTDLRAGFGGVDGRALVAGDRLATGTPAWRDLQALAGFPDADDDATELRIAPWWLDPHPDLDFAQPRPIRVLPGRDAVSPADALFATDWRVGAQGNRQGLRLDGPALQAADTGSRVSEPIAPGTVQLPPDGQPIVLLAEAQTIGGYPRIGHVIAADLPRLAQRRPGETLRFEPVDAATARAAALDQAHRLARMAEALGQRRRDR